VAGISLALQFQENLSPSQPSCAVTDKRDLSLGRNPSSLLLSSTQFYLFIVVTPSLLESKTTLIMISPQFEAYPYKLAGNCPLCSRNTYWRSDH